MGHVGIRREDERVQQHLLVLMGHVLVLTGVTCSLTHARTLRMNMCSVRPAL